MYYLDPGSQFRHTITTIAFGFNIITMETSIRNIKQLSLCVFPEEYVQYLLFLQLQFLYPLCLCLPVCFYHSPCFSCACKSSLVKCLLLYSDFCCEQRQLRNNNAHPIIHPAIVGSLQKKDTFYWIHQSILFSKSGSNH